MSTNGSRAQRSEDGTSLFDRFAGWTADFASHAVFFIACVLLVGLWLPSLLLIRNINTWQLIINTITTIITFLLVALLQNTQRRGDEAIQHKLDCIADGLADLMEHTAQKSDGELRNDIHELREAVGLEQRT